MEDDFAGRWPPWAMLAALTSTFTLSQAFRTVPAIVVGGMSADFAVSPQGIGLFAGAFSIAFGLMQVPIGVALDRFGPRRTICSLFPLAALGAGVSALAPNFTTLVAGQVLIGVGSAPAYISTLVFLVRRYPPGRFAGLSGLTMSVGGMGMLLTATPLAWVVQVWGWRWAFALLGMASILSLLGCFLLLDERREDLVARGSVRAAIGGIVPLLRMRQTAGILCLGAVLYGSFLAVRTPWIVPLFVGRYDYSLVDAGNVVLAFSFAMVVSPVLFGKVDPRGRRRRYLIIGLSYVLAALIGALGIDKQSGALPDWCLAVTLAALSGYATLEYADLRSSFPAAAVGRAIALLNMAMFLGVAVVQWLAGAVAAAAVARGLTPIAPIFVSLAILLAAATTGYWLLPWPRTFDAAADEHGDP